MFAVDVDRRGQEHGKFSGRSDEQYGCGISRCRVLGGEEKDWGCAGSSWTGCTGRVDRYWNGVGEKFAGEESVDNSVCGCRD